MTKKKASEKPKCSMKNSGHHGKSCICDDCVGATSCEVYPCYDKDKCPGPVKNQKDCAKVSEMRKKLVEKCGDKLPKGQQLTANR